MKPLLNRMFFLAVNIYILVRMIPYVEDVIDGSRSHEGFMFLGEVVVFDALILLGIIIAAIGKQKDVKLNIAGVIFGGVLTISAFLGFKIGPSLAFLALIAHTTYLLSGVVKLLKTEKVVH